MTKACCTDGGMFTDLAIVILIMQHLRRTGNSQPLGLGGGLRAIPALPEVCPFQ